MIKISDVVKNILWHDDVAFQALKFGYLNLSAYAAQILSEVEEKTLKPVQKGTIVVALTRLAKEVEETHTLRPPVVLDDLSIRSPLCDITFSKTAQTRKKLTELYQNLEIGENAFFTVTQSMSEITVIAPQALKENILEHFEAPPKALFLEKAAITVRFSEEYLSVPNVLYTIQAALAVHNINFVEIISTYTEFSLILDKEYLEVATQALRQFFR